MALVVSVEHHKHFKWLWPCANMTSSKSSSWLLPCLWFRDESVNIRLMWAPANTTSGTVRVQLGLRATFIPNRKQEMFRRSHKCCFQDEELDTLLQWRLKKFSAICTNQNTALDDTQAAVLKINSTLLESTYSHTQSAICRAGAARRIQAAQKHCQL